MEPNDGSELSFENPDERSDATLAVTVTDGDTLEETVAVGPSSGIDSLQLTIDNEGRLTLTVGVR